MESFSILKIRSASNEFIFATKILTVFYKKIFMDYVFILTTQFWIILSVLFNDLTNKKIKDSLPNSACCTFQTRFKRRYDCHSTKNC